jgi:hypothetical protein
MPPAPFCIPPPSTRLRLAPNNTSIYLLLAKWILKKSPKNYIFLATWQSGNLLPNKLNPLIQKKNLMAERRQGKQHTAFPYQRKFLACWQGAKTVY